MGSLIGTRNADVLIGTEDADTIEGRDGNDLIDGRGGADTMRGGRGDDVFHVDDAGDTVVELSGEGTDEVRSTISYVLGAHVENLTLLGGAIAGTGNGLNNRITGNEAANLIRGGGGTDTFVGGGDDDIYHVEAVATVSKRGGISFSGLDLVIEEAGGGVDTIYSNASLSMPAQVENIVLTGTLDLYVLGNALDNVIVGNSGRNFLQGREGNDHIDGGAGADDMHGGAGNDTFVVDHVSDIVQESFDGGTDRVLSFVSYQLFNSEVEHLALQGDAAINGTGNFRDNEILGNAASNQLDGKEGNDLLDGGAGADQMRGGLGHDVFRIDDAGDVLFEGAGQGDDWAVTSVSYVLGAGAEVETLSTRNASSTASLDLAGNEFGQSIYGNDGANVIAGGGGNDHLVGLGGADTYAFTVAAGAGNVDSIGGFEAGVDRIALDDAVFAGLAAGALPDGAFRIGRGAEDEDDRVVYNPETGALLFDADGAGGAEAVLFAVIQPNLPLTAGDFIVI